MKIGCTPVTIYAKERVKPKNRIGPTVVGKHCPVSTAVDFDQFSLHNMATSTSFF